MALLTDGNPNTSDDLRAYETGIVNVASQEGIDLDAKLTYAADEIGAEILAFLLREWPRDPQSAARRSLRLTTVAVTLPLARWHALETIALLYGEAYNNQLNDRYQGKWQQYTQLARSAGLRYFQDGVGLVMNPVPKAGAPTLTSVAGPVAGQTFFAAVTWLNAAGQEGSPSDPLSFDTGNGGLLVVNPPATPAGATGWNVYAGTTATALALQNTSPLTAGTLWTMSGTGLANGAPVGSGQSPDYYLLDHHEIPRG
jgi:hypothetical protein